MPGQKKTASARPEDLKQLWDRYLMLRAQLEQLEEHADNEDRKADLTKQLIKARNHLMEAYLPLTKACAIRLKDRLPNSVDPDDLYSAGAVGLMDAIERFDPAMGTQFTTFAPRRINGAMLDSLRSYDQVPRLVRDRAKKLERAISKHTKQYGRRPTRSELATILNVPAAELERILDDGQVATQYSLSQPVLPKSSDSDTAIAHTLGDPNAVSPVDSAHKRSLKELFCKMLSRHEQLIIVLYYYEGMTMKEIGQTLDLSESRVSQMHSLVKERLKAQLQDREDLLAS